MKQLILKQMTLLNFKGVRDLTIDFNEDLTSIYGMNGTGKTTIFDAFTWLLFGKDSKDRKQFDLKTLDSDGNVISQIPHEVSAILILGGEQITLCRRFNEKWVKPKGKAEKEFQGHEEERVYNDVPLSKKEWDEKICAICTENVFKVITNPLYFSSQKADVQRAMLFNMAGEISDSEIAKGNKEFEDLLGRITGKTMEEYKKEINAKKKRIRSEYETIPDRIDERKRDIPEAEDWGAIETELNKKNDDLAEIDALISDKVKAQAKANDERLAQTNQLNDIRLKKSNRVAALRQEALSSFHDQKNKQGDLQRKVKDAKDTIERHQGMIKTDQARLTDISAQRDKLIAQWREINARQISFNENDFICPTCGRRYEIDEIESKQDDLRNKFNAKKAEDLKVNNAQGLALKSERETIEERIKRHQGSIAEAEKMIDEISKDPLYTQQLTQPDPQPIIDQDPEYQDLCKQEQELSSILSTPVQAPDNSELDNQKKALNDEIDALKARLMKKETIEKNMARIKELEEMYRNQNEEYARLEAIEFTIQAFSKARIEAVEKRINGMFTMVKFKMFETQINGGEIETCEATVDGVPYSDLNNAMTINAGLDIINAICKAGDISAPIFIDNAESVNQLIPSESQIIRLVVTDTDNTLRVQ